MTPRKHGARRALVQSVLQPQLAESEATPLPAPVEEVSNVVLLPARVSETPKVEKRERHSTKGYEAHTFHLRFKVVASERAEIQRMVARHGAALGTTLAFSHLMRVWLNILKHAEKEVLRAFEKKADLKRPANEDPVALAAYEHELSHLVLEALRNAPPLIRQKP